MDKTEIVNLIKTNVTQFNEQRKSDPALGRGLDLSGVDLAGAELSNVDLSRTDLSNANLKGAILKSANLSSANLEGSDLSDTDVDGANLHSARLKGANLKGMRPEAFVGECRVCLRAESFQETRWDKGQIEAVLEIINQNADWKVQYEIVPK
ncbi:MAG: pentapeptide repeat-containing protein [Dehalococcoidia bacterium]